jgi:hypothetical protein
MLMTMMTNSAVTGSSGISTRYRGLSGMAMSEKSSDCAGHDLHAVPVARLTTPNFIHASSSSFHVDDDDEFTRLPH